jgi:hypothetical protein
MGAAQTDPFGQLEERIRKLMELYEKDRIEIEQLRKEKLDLQEQVKLGEDRVKNIEEKFNKLKISRALIASSDDVHDAKLKVNRMVREIDKCIALLNR